MLSPPSNPALQRVCPATTGAGALLRRGKLACDHFGGKGGLQCLLVSAHWAQLPALLVTSTGEGRLPSPSTAAKGLEITSRSVPGLLSCDFCTAGLWRANVPAVKKQDKPRPFTAFYLLPSLTDRAKCSNVPTQQQFSMTDGYLNCSWWFAPGGLWRDS